MGGAAMNLATRSARAARPATVGSLAPMCSLSEFPALDRELASFRKRSGGAAASAKRGPSVYLDSASTTQKPHAVLAAMTTHYVTSHANVHRAGYELASLATAEYESAREAVACFVNAPDPRGVVFTRSFTEAANLVAHCWARQKLGPQDEILLTELEHHSNMVPWQEAARATGARVRYLRVTSKGELDFEGLESLLTDRTRLVAVSAMSNVTGAYVDLAPIRRAAHRVGALLFVDGAQLTPHAPVDVQAIGADFYAFSAHKLLGPTGIGALVVRPELLWEMEPYQTGGSMIDQVTLEGATWGEPPWRFEAGTPPIAEAAGLLAAIRYLEGCGMNRVKEHERRITELALGLLGELPWVTLYGPGDPARQGAIFAFNISGPSGETLSAQDVGILLDRAGVAIRVGHHCAQPLLHSLGITYCCRASAYLYNGAEDIIRLVRALKQARSLLA